MDNRERFAEQQMALESALSSLQTRLWTALPGFVESFDPANNTVEVQPTIQGVITSSDGTTKAVDLPLLPDVPVYFPRGGGVTLTFPIKQGDECLVVFSSRCIDGWWQSGGSQLAPEFRMHDLSDGFAFIGPMSQPNVIPNIAADVAQLRTDDGRAYLQLNPTNHDVDLVTPANVTAKVDGNVSATVGGNVDAQISGTMTGKATAWNITGPVNITGPLTVSEGISAGAGGSGNISVNGSVTSTGDQIAGGISQVNHTHPDPQGGNTGKPR